MDFRPKLRQVSDFPREGINFIDITTVLQDKDAFNECITQMKDKTSEFEDFDLIIGSESRGFIFGAPLAYILNKGFIPVRKKGRLPYKTVSIEYELEYGADILQMHVDAITPGQKVLIVDDLLATGGTTCTNIELVEKLGGIVVGVLYFIELTYLNGRDKLKGYRLDSIVKV